MVCLISSSLPLSQILIFLQLLLHIRQFIFIHFLLIHTNIIIVIRSLTILRTSFFIKIFIFFWVIFFWFESKLKLKLCSKLQSRINQSVEDRKLSKSEISRTLLNRCQYSGRYIGSWWYLAKVKWYFLQISINIGVFGHSQILKWNN